MIWGYPHLWKPPYCVPYFETRGWRLYWIRSDDWRRPCLPPNLLSDKNDLWQLAEQGFNTTWFNDIIYDYIYINSHIFCIDGLHGTSHQIQFERARRPRHLPFFFKRTIDVCGARSWTWNTWRIATMSLHQFRSIDIIWYYCIMSRIF